jgi:acetyltransferase-like isoleucine patch superfamily enzyme
MKILFRLFVVLLPWALRRHVLRAIYGYEIHPTARIGLAWIFPERLVMAEGAYIGHLNVAIRLGRIELGPHALIHRSNWITGVPPGDVRHFRHVPNRDPALVMGAHAAITKSHHIDCCDRIEIGAFTTVGGYQSQFLTHGIDLQRNRQDAAPITIGTHCFIGTNVVILAGSRLPDRSVLGAKALLNKAHEKPDWIYGGVPAVPIQPVAADAAYFRRTTGFVE